MNYVFCLFYSVYFNVFNNVIEYKLIKNLIYFGLKKQKYIIMSLIISIFKQFKKCGNIDVVRREILRLLFFRIYIQLKDFINQILVGYDIVMVCNFKV